MFKKYYTFAGLLLCGMTAFASADVRISTPHQAVVETQRNQFVRACIDAVREHWGDSGLVLQQKASIGMTADGARLVSLTGTVWQGSERVEVFHQCSQQPGSTTLALYVDQPAATIAKVDQEG